MASFFENILIIDDSAASQSIKHCLELSGHRCEVISSNEVVLDVLSKQVFDVILVDQDIPSIDCVELIRLCTSKFPNLVPVLMSSENNTHLKHNAISRTGADYINKPIDPKKLISLVNKLIKNKNNITAVSNQDINAKLTSEVVYASNKMHNVLQGINRVAKYNTTLLIQGQTGCGKELLARTLHTQSRRADKPFVAINCGAIPDNLIESELFGHKKGAFTDAIRDKTGLFEIASGGTIFLDEIADLPQSMQVKLLRVLQEQEIQIVGDVNKIKIDVRIVAASNKSLEAEVKAGRFREDLFFRLNTVTIEVPALRDRPEDIPVLVKHFISKFNKKLGESITKVEPAALEKLLTYHWPGNVRELENCIERAIVFCQGQAITTAVLPLAIQQVTGTDLYLYDTFNSLSIKKHTAYIEKKLITQALEQTAGNRTHAAKLLEISHRALLYKLKEYRLVEYAKK